MRPTRRALLSTAATLSTVFAGCIGDGSDDGTTEDTTEATADATDEGESTVDGEPGDDGTATVQVREHRDLGDILAGPNGMTLYMFDQDEEGEGASACYGGCAESWPPLVVEKEPTAGDAVTAELSTFERDDGERQVAAGGWPLYYFASDEEPGDANGQGANDVWWVLAPDGTPVRDDGSTAEEESGSGEDTPEEDEDDGNGESNDPYRVRTRA